MLQGMLGEHVRGVTLMELLWSLLLLLSSRVWCFPPFGRQKPRPDLSVALANQQPIGIAYRPGDEL